MNKISAKRVKNCKGQKLKIEVFIHWKSAANGERVE